MPSLQRIGFGSCHNQRKEPGKHAFSRLAKQDFDLFVWSGDVVYNKESSVETLAEAYAQMREQGAYAKFLQHLPFGAIGTWDDHDFGTNDGGGVQTPNVMERQALFLDFLQVPESDLERRVRRRGVYASHVFPGKHAGQSVKIILLDTRFHRSNYFLSNLGSLGEGHWYGKLSPIAAALSRTLSQLTNLHEYLARHKISNHDMLGAEQWDWLEKELVSSESDVNILVSSIQVFSANPSVESWALFPTEQQRLLDLLRLANPRGLLIVSGDVHVGQLVYSDLEMTSSGLTHTCTDGGIPFWLCALAFNLFGGAQNTLFDRNFGQIDIDWDAQAFTARVQSMTDADKFLQVNRTFEPWFGQDASREFELQVIPPSVRYGLLSLTLFALVFVAWLGGKIFFSKKIR